MLVFAILLSLDIERQLLINLLAARLSLCDNVSA